MIQFNIRASQHAKAKRALLRNQHRPIVSVFDVSMFALLGTGLLNCHNSASSDSQAAQRVGVSVPSANAVATTYTCPMHPEINSKHPGRCPKCGMDLVPNKPQSGPPSEHDH